MKNFKRILLLLVVIITIAVIYNYPKLNMIAGYAAKNTASSIFVADRTLDFTIATDNNFSPINLASNKVNNEKHFIHWDGYAKTAVPCSLQSNFASDDD